MFKKILIYGENWEGTLPRLLLDDLRSKSYSVEIFDFTDFLPGIKNRSLGERIKRRLFGSFYNKIINDRFTNKVHVFKPDIVIVAKGLNLSKSTLENISSLGIYLVNWNPDDFFNLKNSNKQLINMIPKYNLIVSSRLHLSEKYSQFGAKDFFFLDWYYVPNLHYNHFAKKSINASFVGSWSPRREEFIYNLNTQFHIWGGGWHKASSKFKNKHIVNNQILSQKQMSYVFNSSVYNLNLLTHENNDLSNLRFFEVTASSGLLLTERNDIAKSYLIDEVDCLMFNDENDLNSIFLKKYDLEKITLNGFKKITQGKNSFSDRVDSLLDYLKHKH